MQRRDVNVMLVAAQAKAQKIMREFLEHYHGKQGQMSRLEMERMMEMMQEPEKEDGTEENLYRPVG